MDNNTYDCICRELLAYIWIECYKYVILGSLKPNSPAVNQQLLKLLGLLQVDSQLDI